jgi:predicted RNA-binding Zn-ribbon protein involved in translation (DUF1610 family)
MVPTCPNCREPMSRWRLFASHLASRWRCKNCNALLGINQKRRLIIIVIGVFMLFFGIPLIEWAGLRAMVVAPTLAVAMIGAVWLFDQPRLIEATGVRCRGCGYDVRGQQVMRCPECGRVFDEEELQRLSQFRAGALSDRAGRGRSRSEKLAFTSVIALLVVLGICFVVVAFLVGQRMLGGGGRAPALAPAAAPALNSADATSPKPDASDSGKPASGTPDAASAGSERTNEATPNTDPGG